MSWMSIIFILILVLIIISAIRFNLFGIFGGNPLDYFQDDEFGNLYKNDKMFYNTGESGLNEIVDKGKYLAEGAFGKVFLATRKTNGEQVVIKQQKLLKPDSELDANATALFAQAEIRSYRAAAANNCNVVKLHEVFYDENTTELWYVMDLIDGKELSKMPELKEWSERDLCDKIVNPLISQLKCLHAHDIAHRDIKPDNSMYSESKQNAILIDLGVACYEDKCYNGYYGTRWYQPPEYDPNNETDYAVRYTDIEGAKNADIWALGCTIYNAITGSRLVNEYSFDETNGGTKGLPLSRYCVLNDKPLIQEFVLGCTALNPETRRKYFDSISNGIMPQIIQAS